MRVAWPIDQLKSRDPERSALHRAIRAAVVIPAGFAFSFEVIGDSQVATFAAFGGFALLLFVDFPGDRTGRLTSYVMLSLVGVVFITLGTLASHDTALAAGAMTVVGFLVLFAGTLSSSIAAAGRAALLLFILPVTLPAPAGQIGFRLAGWGIAVAIAVPAAMLVWPPKEHDNLRRYAAEVCAAIADVIVARGAAEEAQADAHCERLSQALNSLRRAFRSSTSRPVGLTTGSRLLIRLVDELEWLGAITATLSKSEMTRWSAIARDTVQAAADALQASAGMLRERRGAGSDSDELHRALFHLGEERRRVAASTGALLAAPSASPSTAWPYQGHELAYAASLVGVTVEWAAAADARPPFARWLGRPAAHQGHAPLSPARDIATSQFERHSVWLQNAVRGGIGLGLAVLVAELSGAQHAFWVVLGALSVLRGNASSTGSTVVRALMGTVVGFAIGAVVVFGIGTTTGILWALLPVALLIAALAPQVISFAAGQAGFTVLLLILYNIIAPVGWRVGLVRIEDIALGCATSLVVGALLWPRGATAAIGTALGHAYRSGAHYLDRAVASTMGLGAPASAELRDTLAAGRRLDDAFRQYLAERGAQQASVQDLTITANGAVRIRLAGEAIAALRPPDLPDAPLPPPSRHLAGTIGLVQLEVAAVRDYYLAVADQLDRHASRGQLPPETLGSGRGEVLASLRRDIDPGVAGGSVTPRIGEVEEATRLLWTALYLQDMRMLESRLRDALTESSMIGRRPAPTPGSRKEVQSITDG